MAKLVWFLPGKYESNEFINKIGENAEEGKTGGMVSIRTKNQYPENVKIVQISFF